MRRLIKVGRARTSLATRGARSPKTSRHGARSRGASFRFQFMYPSYPRTEICRGNRGHGWLIAPPDGERRRLCEYRLLASDLAGRALGKTTGRNLSGAEPSTQESVLGPQRE